MKIQYLGRGNLVPSKTNPRKDFKDLGDLASSIKEKGILEPLLVRMTGNHLSAKCKDPIITYEIVAGERRFRAAELAGLTEVPCIIRDLTDQQVIEVQVIENMQRQDLTPLEEATGYKTLHEKHGYSWDDLAAKIGKSKTYIYRRLNLLNLIPAAQQKLSSGEWPVSWAEELTRILDPQDQAEIVKMHWISELSDLKENIEERLLFIKNAPFSSKDKNLPPCPCVKCEKRTSHDPDLFGEASRTDRCLDKQCWRTKTGIYQKAELKRYKADGYKVLDKQIRGAGRNQDGLLDTIDSTNYSLKGKLTWAQAFKRAGLQNETTKTLVSITTNEAGKVVQVVDVRAALGALPRSVKAGHPHEESKPLTPEAKEKQKKELEKQKLQEAIEERTTELAAAALVAKIAKLKIPTWLMDAMIDLGYTQCDGTQTEKLADILLQNAYESTIIKAAGIDYKKLQTKAKADVKAGKDGTVLQGKPGGKKC